jgi:hypothetical protein
MRSAKTADSLFQGEWETKAQIKDIVSVDTGTRSTPRHYPLTLCTVCALCCFLWDISGTNIYAGTVPSEAGSRFNLAKMVA